MACRGLEWPYGARTDSDVGGVTAHHAVGMAVVRALSAPRAAGLRRRRHPLGRRRVERPATAAAATTRVRRSSIPVGAAMTWASCRFRIRLNKKGDRRAFGQSRQASSPSGRLTKTNAASIVPAMRKAASSAFQSFDWPHGKIFAADHHKTEKASIPPPPRVLRC